MADAEALELCLRLITDIRSSSAYAWKCAADGVTNEHGEDSSSRDKKFLSELKVNLDTVGIKIKELDQALQSIQLTQSPLPLGHSTYLAFDGLLETKSGPPFYCQLVDSYKWFDKAQEYAKEAAYMLSQNSLSRSSGKVTKSRRRTPASCHNAPPQVLDAFIVSIGRVYCDMQFQIQRPNATKLNAIVEVTLKRVMRAVIIFKGMMIEWVVVRGFNEEPLPSNMIPLNPWEESRYNVFRRITENANAAMLNFQSATFPELANKSFMTYLHSFVTLFTDKCKKCGCHLKNNTPPTWREFKTLEPYHEDCRQ